jgi:hypothetical protein
VAYTAEKADSRRTASSSFLHATFAIAASLLWASSAAAQVRPVQPVSPFIIVGFIQDATLGNNTDPLSGGTLTVNNQVITIPRNTIVLMPATAITWEEVFALAPLPYGPTKTGLALRDTPTPSGAYEVTVQGNRVGDEYIAGLVSLSQLSLFSSQGFINFIDYATGELRVGGVMGDNSTGQRVRINDPLGKFGRVFSPDVRFTIDEDNPTIRTETAYPMCLPRVDPAGAVPDDLCPQYNRPIDFNTGFYATIFTMNSGEATPVADRDPRKQMPFEMGDYVTYAGILVKDGGEPTVGPLPGASATYVAAYSMVANLGVFTVPFSNPAYVALDVTILGVGGAPAPGLPQEATVRTKFEGFTTDPSRHIDLYGMDVDPCTGTVSDRFWGSVGVDQGPPLGAVKGRWRFQPPTRALSVAPTFLPPTREVRARINSALLGSAANGLLAGQYHAPITEYLFPENLGIGNPPVPLNLQDFPFLAKGSGPWGGAGPVVRQLSPWPGLPVPVPSNCPGVPPPPGSVVAPVANAGLPLAVNPNFLVTLDGTGSFDPQGLPLTYAWTQTLGPPLLLVNATTPTPTFVAPPTFGVIPLAFQLIVSNGTFTSSATAIVNVVSNADTVTILSALYRAGKERLSVTASSTDPTALLFLVIPGSSPVQLTPLNGVLTATLVGVAQPASVTITSSLGGTATGPLTRVR